MFSVLYLILWKWNNFYLQNPIRDQWSEELITKINADGVLELCFVSVSKGLWHAIFSFFLPKISVLSLDKVYKTQMPSSNFRVVKCIIKLEYISITILFTHVKAILTFSSIQLLQNRSFLMIHYVWGHLTMQLTLWWKFLFFWSFCTYNEWGEFYI